MFENTLIETMRKPQPKKKLMTFPIAVAIHVVAIGAVLVMQLWAVEKLPEPTIMATFYQAPPPPPPPPPPKAAAAPKAPPATQVRGPEVQPVEIPQEIPKANSSGVGVEGGVEGGIEGGEMGGVIGGVPGGVPGPTPVPTPESDVPIRVGGAIATPERTYFVDPVYPEIARKARIEGVAVLEATIDKGGNVVGVKVLRGLPMGLSEAAVQAVEKWKYRPATLNGRPVSVLMTVTIKFTLRG